MEHVLAVDLGTFCDNRLMEFAMAEVIKRYKVIYLTDRSHKLDERYYIRETFDTPDFFIKDPKLEVANTKKNFAAWMITHPGKTYKAYAWSKDVRGKVKALIGKYKPKCIMILYPALSVVWMLETSIPIYILYYAPGIVSYTLPWLFDSTMKDPDLILYKDSEYNKNSGMTYLSRVSEFSRCTIEPVMSSLNHVFCWDPSVLPPLNLYFPKLRVTQVGTLVSKETRNGGAGLQVPKVIQDIVATGKPMIFMSFGSYGDTIDIRPSLEKLFIILNEFCKRNNATVVFHNGSFTTPNGFKHIIAVNGYLPYEYIVPRSKLVIFTGSACLQNICLYNAIPMLFFPILNEQFFWAKNYMHHTGVTYVDFTAPFTITSTHVKRAMVVNEYILGVRKGITRRNAARRILKLVDSAS